jgi:hypothetical protein
LSKNKTPGGKEMRPNITTAFFVIFGLSLTFIAVGCHHRRADRGRADGAGAEEKIAPSDGKEAAISIVDKGGEGIDLPEREEISRVYKLEPAAVVDVQGINGSIDVETAEVEIAEVLIVRSANKKDELQYRKINIEHQPKFLRIRIDNDRKSIFSEFGTIPEGRQRVMLKVPRSVVFRTNGLNGNLTTGEFDRKVEINGVNGQVKIGRSTGQAAFRGINGKIEATVAKLSDDGISLTGVNGDTDLRFIGDVNATIEANGFHGEVKPDLPNVEVQSGESNIGFYKARIGSGGIRVRINGVNGNVFLGRAEKSIAESPKASTKSK